MMGECKDCKNWNNDLFGDWGECKRMRSDKDHHPVDGDTWAHSEGANGTVTTAPDFGCIMFQVKEGEGYPSTAALEIALQVQDYAIGTIDIARMIEEYAGKRA
jgi:hypothetical protein